MTVKVGESCRGTNRADVYIRGNKFYGCSFDMNQSNVALKLRAAMNPLLRLRLSIRTCLLVTIHTHVLALRFL